MLHLHSEEAEIFPVCLLERIRSACLWNVLKAVEVIQREIPALLLLMFSLAQKLLLFDYGKPSSVRCSLNKPTEKNRMQTSCLRPCFHY